MKGLNLTTVVLGLTCGTLSAYPFWNEQKKRIEDTNPLCSYDYNGMKDKDLLRKLVMGDQALLKGLRTLAQHLDKDTMNFLGNMQNTRRLSDEISVSGSLSEILGYDKISAPTGILIYQGMFSEENETQEELGRDYDRYVEAMMSDPFASEDNPF